MQSIRSSRVPSPLLHGHREATALHGLCPGGVSSCGVEPSWYSSEVHGILAWCYVSAVSGCTFEAVRVMTPSLVKGSRSLEVLL